MNENKSELQIVDQSDAILELRCRDHRGDWDFLIKWDGCVDVRRYFNGNLPENPGPDDDDTDYIHLCDIDQTIELLQEVKRKAIEKFGGWPG